MNIFSTLAHINNPTEMVRDILEQIVEEKAKGVVATEKAKLDATLAREGRSEVARACFDFLPTRALLDLNGWPETDIFAHS